MPLPNSICSQWTPQALPLRVASLLLVLICWLSSSVQAQTAVTRSQAHPKALRDYETAVQAVFKGDLRNAVRYFEAALKREPHFADALSELAGAYYDVGNYAEAERYLERLAGLEGDPAELSLYGLAMTEFKQNKYGEAFEHLDAYLKREDIRVDRRKAAERYRAEARFRKAALSDTTKLYLRRLPSTVNTQEHAEYLPALSADGQTLIFTRRIGNNEDFYAAIRDASDGSWQRAQPLTNVNTLDNEGAQSLSADGRYLVFTACGRSDGLGSCDLYASYRTSSGWSEPRNLGAPINSKAWESQPSLSANGNLLFFASRRPGGEGAADLWASARQVDGTWSEPINLGPTVNTDSDEQAPFFHADGRSLYFMSDGHPGMGGFDLFVTRLDTSNRWLEPYNLGYPLNTSANEGALTVAIDGRTAYYASDAAQAQQRGAQGPGTIGIGGRRGSTTDLYSFTLPAAARAGEVTYLRARISDAVTGEPLAAVATLREGPQDKIVTKRRAGEEDGDLLVVLPRGREYALSVEHPGYAFHSERFELRDSSRPLLQYELFVELQPLLADSTSEAGPAPATREPIVLRNVLFEPNSAVLLPESAGELNRLVELLRSYPEQRISIQGHTDDVGSEEDNQVLSEARAASVRDYLLAQGIAAERLEVRGFGESQPLVDGTDEESRRLNRRTAFLLL